MFDTVHSLKWLIGDQDPVLHVMTGIALNDISWHIWYSIEHLSCVWQASYYSWCGVSMCMDVYI